MPKFTLGPWIITGLPQRKGNFGIWSNAGSVASVSKGRNGSPYTKPMLVEEGHANAHLIAAAPELYWALKEMLVHCIWDTAYADRAKAALAKADGEE